MHRIAQGLVAAALVTLAGSPSRAADVVAPEVYDWTGFYIGGNIGYGFGGSDSVGLVPDTGKVGDLSVEGAFGGGQIGGNWQVNSWVFGIEGDIQAAGISDSDKRTRLDEDRDLADFRSKDNIDWFSTVRGRLGFAWDRALIYGTGGLAVGGVSYKLSLNEGDEFAKWDDDYTEVGWTAGGGLEWAFSDAFSAKLEYLYVNLGKQSIHRTAGEKEYNDVTNATPDFHSVRFGINYHF